MVSCEQVCLCRSVYVCKHLRPVRLRCSKYPLLSGLHSLHWLDFFLLQLVFWVINISRIVCVVHVYIHRTLSWGNIYISCKCIGHCWVHYKFTSLYYYLNSTLQCSVSQIRFQCQNFINTQSVRHHILNVYKEHSFQNQVYPWNKFRACVGQIGNQVL